MRILITGGSGFIGKALVNELLKDGHSICIYTHKSNSQRNFNFPLNVKIVGKEDYFPDSDVIVNLAGESIAEKSLTKERVKKILSSRLDMIDLLNKKFEGRFPPHFIQASATGIYGNGFNLDEKSQLSDSLYANICKAVEEKANSLSLNHRTNVSICRIGIVIGQGGGLVRNLTYFPTLHILGATNFVPYLYINDCINALRYIINRKIYGIINLCSDNYLTVNKILEIASSHKKIKIPVIKMCLNLDKRGSLLLVNQQVLPQVLIENGFTFSKK